jgi:hypothetical protein
VETTQIHAQLPPGRIARGFRRQWPLSFRVVSRGTRLFGLLVVALSACALAPGLALADPSSVSVSFFRGNAPATGPRAGEHVGYGVTFTTANGLDNGTNATVVTIGTASGTQLPSNVSNYTFITSNPVGSCLAANVSRPIPEAVQVTAGCTAAPNSSVLLTMGRFGSGSTGGNVTNPTTAGAKSLTVQTTKETGTGTGNYTILPDVPDSLAITGGSNQSTTVGTDFTGPLEVTLTDQYSNPISGAQIDWSLPTAGFPIATGHFPGAMTVANSNTDANGVATSPTVTASTVAGQWHPTAALDSDSANFTRILNLTNLPGIGHELTLGLSPDTISADGSSTSVATATVKDANANPVAGDTVAFTAPNDPDVQVSTTTDNGDGTYSATFTAPGRQSGGDVLINALDTSSSDSPGAGQALHLTGDTTAPSLTIDSAPSSVIHSSTAEVDFHSADGTATFKCKLDTAAAEDCSSPYTRSSLSEGGHKITVTATDAAGNSAAPAVESFIVDAHKPKVSISGPRKTTDRTPTFKLKPSEDDVQLECKLGSAAFKPCGGTYKPHRLAPGKYKLTVRATDAADNSTTAKKKFKIKR